jgi:UDP-N-acetyl-D-mannosaminuronic acid transferase (WecB/TagA/CpsF family)
VSNPSSAIQKLPVLGTPVAVVDYSSAIAECQRLAREPRPAAVAASNTHIISLAHPTLEQKNRNS